MVMLLVPFSSPSPTINKEAHCDLHFEAIKPPSIAPRET